MTNALFTNSSNVKIYAMEIYSYLGEVENQIEKHF
jgi:hypothetical protein